MNELELSQSNKDRIKGNIKVTLTLGLLFTIALIAVVLVIPTILVLFNIKPDEGLIKRGLIIIGALFLPMLVISWKNIIKYIELKSGKKARLMTGDYEIKEKKDGFVLRINTPLKLEFDLHDKLPELIKLKEPITIELTQLSRTLLFISQDNVNLLDMVERTNKTDN